MDLQALPSIAEDWEGSETSPLKQGLAEQVPDSSAGRAHLVHSLKAGRGHQPPSLQASRAQQAAAATEAFVQQEDCQHWQAAQTGGWSAAAGAGVDQGGVQTGRAAAETLDHLRSHADQSVQQAESSPAPEAVRAGSRAPALGAAARRAVETSDGSGPREAGLDQQCGQLEAFRSHGGMHPAAAGASQHCTTEQPCTVSPGAATAAGAGRLLPASAGNYSQISLPAAAAASPADALTGKEPAVEADIGEAAPTCLSSASPVHQPPAGSQQAGGKPARQAGPGESGPMCLPSVSPVHRPRAGLTGHLRAGASKSQPGPRGRQLARQAGGTQASTRGLAQPRMHASHEGSGVKRGLQGALRCWVIAGPREHPAACFGWGCHGHCMRAGTARGLQGLLHCQVKSCPMHPVS